MAEKTLTFSSTELFTKIYSTTELKETDTAKQGFYDGYASPAVGVIRFDGLADINWKTKSIRSIGIVFHHAVGGTYGTNKTFGLHRSKKQSQSADSTSYGYEWLGEQSIGEFTLYCSRDSDVGVILPDYSSTILTNIEEYLRSGAVDTFCLYMNETDIGNGSYTANYLAVSSMTLAIVFEDISSSGVKYGLNGEWKSCIVNYGINNTWQPCKVWYGLNNEWIPIGGENGNLTYIAYPTAAMTSDNSQNCIASASSVYSASTYPAYKAFDNERNYAWASTTDDTSPWIQLQLPQALRNISVKVYNWDTTNKYKGDPVSGTLLGSSDGATWTQIGSYSGWSADTNGLLGEIICDNTEEYNYVRLTISEYTSGKSYVSIGNIIITGGILV